MTSRTVGQVWVYTLYTGIYEIILLTSISKENVFRGILLYSTYKEAEMIGLEVKTGLSFLRRSHNYCLWTCPL